MIAASLGIAKEMGASVGYLPREFSKYEAQQRAADMALQRPLIEQNGSKWDRAGWHPHKRQLLILPNFAIDSRAMRGDEKIETLPYTSRRLQRAVSLHELAPLAF